MNYYYQGACNGYAARLYVPRNCAYGFCEQLDKLSCWGSPNVALADEETVFIGWEFGYFEVGEAARILEKAGFKRQEV